MDLTDITLEAISKSEYERLHRVWHNESSSWKSGTAEIVIPYVAHDYLELLAKFVEHPLARYAQTKVNGKKNQWPAALIRTSAALDIVEHLTRDRSPNHFALFFGEYDHELSKLDFRAEHNLVISYAIRIVGPHKELFTWETPSRYNNVRGLLGRELIDELEVGNDA